MAGALARVFVKVQHVNSKGLNEPQWDCSNSLLLELAKMTLGSPEPYANLRKNNPAAGLRFQVLKFDVVSRESGPQVQKALVFIKMYLLFILYGKYLLF